MPNHIWKRKKWAFMYGYLFAKEALYGQGAPSRFTNNESPYTSSNTWSRTQLMSEPLAEESTLINDGTDHS